MRLQAHGPLSVLELSLIQQTLLMPLHPCTNIANLVKHIVTASDRLVTIVVTIVNHVVTVVTILKGFSSQPLFEIVITVTT